MRPAPECSVCLRGQSSCAPRSKVSTRTDVDARRSGDKRLRGPCDHDFEDVVEADGAVRLGDRWRTCRGSPRLFSQTDGVDRHASRTAILPARRRVEIGVDVRRRYIDGTFGGEPRGFNEFLERTGRGQRKWATGPAVAGAAANRWRRARRGSRIDRRRPTWRRRPRRPAWRRGDLRSAAAVSVAYCTELNVVTASKVPSANGSSSRSPWRRSPSGPARGPPRAGPRRRRFQRPTRRAGGELQREAGPAADVEQRGSAVNASASKAAS